MSALMPFIPIILILLMFVLSLAFKVAGKFRLTLPLLYFLAAIVSPLFTDWTVENEDLVLLGLYILLGLVALSWIYSLVKTIRQKRQLKQSEEALECYVAWQLQRTRELGIAVDQVILKEDGTVCHADTHEPILPYEAL